MSDTTATKPLDAERARLRAKGLSDDEIRDYFVRLELQQHSQPPSGAATGAAGVAGQGVFSGVLSSLLAVTAHARDTVFTIRKDVETLFTSGAPLPVRAGATASLTVKAAVVGVLAFAAWQEWQQHIIYATEIARLNMQKVREEAASAHAQSCSAIVEALGKSLAGGHVVDALGNRRAETAAQERYDIECTDFVRHAPATTEATNTDALRKSPPVPADESSPLQRTYKLLKDVPGMTEQRITEACKRKYGTDACSLSPPSP